MRLESIVDWLSTPFRSPARARGIQLLAAMEMRDAARPAFREQQEMEQDYYRGLAHTTAGALRRLTQVHRLEAEHVAYDGIE